MKTTAWTMLREEAFKKAISELRGILELEPLDRPGRRLTLQEQDDIFTAVDEIYTTLTSRSNHA